MALPTGLVPILAFVLTVGVAVPVTAGAHLRSRNRPFDAALRTAVLAVFGVYLVGVAAVWAVAGGVQLWEVAAALLLAGAVALVVLTVLPLLVGRLIVRRVGGIAPETAFRFATYGWLVAAFVVFGVFVAPGGIAGGHLLDLEGSRVCLAGFCGIAVSLVAAALLELVVAVLGPGVVGLLLYASVTRTGGPASRSEP